MMLALIFIAIPILLILLLIIFFTKKEPLKNKLRRLLKSSWFIAFFSSVSIIALSYYFTFNSYKFESVISRLLAKIGEFHILFFWHTDYSDFYVQLLIEGIIKVILLGMIIYFMLSQLSKQEAT